MKKILILLTICSLAFANADAQKKEVSIKDTLANTDTSSLIVKGMGSKLKSFEIDANKISGTVSCTIYLQGTVTGITWFNIDSLVMANTAGTQTKLIKFTSTDYYSYRTYAITSGTQSFSYSYGYLRRSDE